MTTKQNIIIIALAVSLILVVQFVLLEEWAERTLQKQNEIFGKGYEEGLRDAVATIYYNIEGCRTTSITIENSTKNILDVSCLNINSDSESP